MNNVYNLVLVNNIKRFRNIVAKATDNGLDTFTNSEIEEAKSLCMDILTELTKIDGLKGEYVDLYLQLRSFHKTLEKYIN
jgi:hypothetical protein